MLKLGWIGIDAIRARIEQLRQSGPWAMAMYAVLLLSFSCSKKTEICEHKLCFNGGICVDGGCQCVNGYTGLNCEIVPSACAGVVCLNGGSCSNGSCECPQGFTGDDCSLQVTPSEILVKSITITSYPGTDGGAGWDLPSRPDIYPVIHLGSAVIWSAPDLCRKADPTQYHTFTPDPAFNLTSPTSQYTITLVIYDDIGTDDLLGSLTFTPYCSTKGFPSTLTLAPAGVDVTITIDVSYTW